MNQIIANLATTFKRRNIKPTRFEEIRTYFPRLFDCLEELSLCERDHADEFRLLVEITHHWNFMRPDERATFVATWPELAEAIKNIYPQ